jgi:hypothetical protein
MYGHDQTDIKGNRKYALDCYMYILSRAKQAGEENKPYIQKTLQIINNFSYNPQTVKEVVDRTLLRLERTFAQNLLNHNMFMPPRINISGQIAIGKIAGTERNAYLSMRNLNENIGLWGRAGVGKTNFAQIICLQLITHGISVRAYDYKNEYRDLIPHIPDMLVLNPTFDKFNPLEPVGDPQNWLQFLADTFQQDFNMRPETKFMWLNYAEQLYQKFGVYNYSHRYPNFKDMRDFLVSEAENKSTSASNRRKIYTCLETIHSIQTSLGSMFNCRSGYTEKALSGFSFISYEMSNLSSNIQSWLTKIRLKHLYEKCLSDPIRHRLKTVGIFDEAKMLFGKNLHAGGSSIGYIKQLVTQARSSGFGAIISDQNRSELADFAVNNLSCQVCFNLVSPKEIRSTGYSIGCNDQQVKYIRYLKIPNAIMSFAGIPPFMVQIPKSPVVRHITDYELKSIMKDRLSQIHSNSDNEENFSPPVINSVEKPHNYYGDYMITLRDFLRQIKSSPDSSVTQHYSALKLSGRKGNKIKSQLFDNQLIVEETIRTGSRKRPAKKISITQKGEEFLKWLNKKVKAE